MRFLANPQRTSSDTISVVIYSALLAIFVLAWAYVPA
jgi:hypothetical protein